MTNALQEDFTYYRENQEEFVRNFDGRVVVIKNRNILGDFESQLEAVTEISKDHEKGTFLVQRVSHGDEAYTMRFFSPGVAKS